MTTATLDIPTVRNAFPALNRPEPFLFADNAGGSQCLASVAGAISDYLLNANAQLGADYSVSVASGKLVAAGVEAARTLFNAERQDEVFFSSSSTQCAENLARALEADFKEGDEIIITPEHEANAGPWKKLAARRGCVVKTWRPSVTDAENPVSVALKIEELLPLVSARTRLVAFTACSNILGSVVPVADVVREVRAKAAEVGAKKVETCVDCVAYAPHRLIDVRAWDVDYCFFSYYKVYGPHIASLYARAACLASSCSSLAHHFLSASAPGSANAYKLGGPSGPCYELASSGPAIVAYLRSLTPEGTLAAAGEAIAAQEKALLEVLLGFLTSPAMHARGVRIVGSAKNDAARVPTVSFLVLGERAMPSRALVGAIDRTGGIGIRFGHFYAYTLVSELAGVRDVEDGVVRISLVHYNTVEEVERLVRAIEQVLA